MFFNNKKLQYFFVVLASYTFFLQAEYPSYQEFSIPSLPKGEGSYKNFYNQIEKKEVKSILEIGSRDALDAIELSQIFQCHVFAFECNPAALDLCRKHINNNPNITLIPMAVWNKSAKIPFYHVPQGNIGASSCFTFNPQAPNYPRILKDGLTQEKIEVDAIRLDDFLKQNNFDSIDLLCMDVQGAAYEVLESLGIYLQKVKYIIVELEYKPIYTNEVLYKDVNSFLIKHGFIRKTRPTAGRLFSDFFYVNSNLIN